MMLEEYNLENGKLPYVQQEQPIGTPVPEIGNQNQQINSLNGPKFSTNQQSDWSASNMLSGNN